MQKQFLKRECDNPKCDTKVAIEMGRALTPAEETMLATWIILTKEYALVSGQPPQPFTKHGCSASCAVEILRNGLLELPNPKKVPAAN